MNFFPSTPDGGYKYRPESVCAMGSFAVRALHAYDQMQVFYPDGHEVPLLCCPAAEYMINALWEPGEPCGRQLGLQQLTVYLSLLRPLLRLEFLAFYYGKATCVEMHDDHGEPISRFAGTHAQYGLQTYDHKMVEDGCGVCFCHGSFWPIMGRPPDHFTQGSEGEAGPSGLNTNEARS